jgi:hypothetical protein
MKKSISGIPDNGQGLNTNLARLLKRSMYYFTGKPIIHKSAAIIALEWVSFRDSSRGELY